MKHAMMGKNEDGDIAMVSIALLRGINVGGKNMIKMAELKTALEAAGLSAVQTYIQSGNILFRSQQDEAALRLLIEDTIRARFALTVPVVLRTATELDSLISNLPFSKDEIAKAQAGTEAEVLYAALLNEALSDERIAQVLAYKSADEQMVVAGRDVYLLFSDSIRNSKLASHLIKLDESVTTRNWKTVLKLSELAKTLTP